MALDTIAHYVKELAEPIKGFAQTVADPSKYLDKIKAYGDISGDTGKYFCNPDNVGVEKRMYGEEIRDFNGAIEFYKTTNPGASEKEVGDYLIGITQNSDINKMAECLTEKHGIVDLDTIASFSPQVQSLYDKNLEALYMVAPDLADHADVPFTGEPILDTMIAGGIVVGSTIGLTKMGGKMKNLFYNYKM